MEVGGFPPIYLYQSSWGKTQQQKLQLGVSIRKNPEVVKVIFCLFSLPRRRRQDSSPIVCVHQRRSPEFPKRLLLDGLLYNYFLTAVRGITLRIRLLLGGRSRDCTAYIFLHRHCTTTSTEVLPRLVWLIQRITAHRLPPAIAPPLGTLLTLLWFYLFTVLNLPSVWIVLITLVVVIYVIWVC
jgi:hypothetical protein